MDIRHPTEADHLKIISVMKDWWGGRDLRQSVPRLFLIHFTSTSFIAEKNGELVGFLIGFFSPDHETVGYIHFAGIHPDFQRKGLGKKLYHLFFETCKKKGRHIIQSCTAPVNKNSIAFHTKLGFQILPSENKTDGIFIHLDYNRPGDEKVLFEKTLRQYAGRIQKAGPADARLLSDLISASYLDVAQTFNLTPGNCPKHPSNCTKNWVERDFNRGVLYYILYKDGLPAGCAGLETIENKTAYLERLAVLPEYRHNGLGRQLIDHIFASAKQMGVKTIRIGIISEQDNLKEWYRTIGFIYVDTKKFDHLPFQVGYMKIDL